MKIETKILILLLIIGYSTIESLLTKHIESLITPILLCIYIIIELKTYNNENR